jgi:hypothetical protein
MGWYGTFCKTKADLVAELTAPTALGGGGTRSTIAHAVRGTTLWAVHEDRYPSGSVTRSIHAYTHIERERESGCFGYKPVPESYGPIEESCPIRFFALAGEPDSEYAVAWRARVRAAQRRPVRASR